MSGSTQPVFSILTSVYRTEAYFPETIESVRAQTLQDWELVVVDNGMSDEVVRIVEKYSDDPRIRLVRQENNGLGGGIDAAAAVARGRYYAVLDSDDLLMPTFCERTAAILDARPEIDVVGIDAYLFEDEDGQDQIRSYRQSVGIRTPAELEHPIGLVEMIGGNVLYYTAAIRAEAWARGGGYSCDTPKVEDLAMFLRMLAADCDIRCLPERLARYRYVPTPSPVTPLRSTRSRPASSGRSSTPSRSPTRPTCSRRWTAASASCVSTRRCGAHGRR